MDAFKVDPSRKDVGRSHRKMPDEGVKQIHTLLKDVLSGHSVPEDKVCAAFKPDLQPTLFAIAKDRVTVSPESGHQASLRSAECNGCRLRHFCTLLYSGTLSQPLRPHPEKVCHFAFKPWLRGQMA
jgi:hypothetical protein